MRETGVLVLLLFSSVSISAGDTTNDVRTAPGDYKSGYADSEYRTDSLSLELRSGKPADLFKISQTRQLGLPALDTDEGPPDKLKIQLGRKLFYDRRLSRNKTMSCAMCHIPEQGFTSNELSRPIGFEGRNVRRNAPTILNIAFAKTLFHDARENTLAQQAWSPLLAPNEMNNASVGAVIETIRASPDYAGLFEKAFKQPPDMLNIGLALAQYQRSLISGDSRFDRWYYGRQRNALNTAEISGFQLFMGKGRCAACHTIGEQFALFSDGLLHNTGVGYRYSMVQPPDTIPVQLAPGVTATVKRDVITSVGEPRLNDLGRYEITLDPADRWKYRTPTLRNIALTAPYMHNGEFRSLPDVVAFYNSGGHPHELLSPMIKPLDLSVQEQADLVAFLNSLTGNNIKTLIADAFAVPIGDQDSQQ